MAAKPQKVSLYSISDLKNATDDALAPYLTALPKPYTFTQHYLTTNVRLGLGYAAVIIAGVLFYADWKLGWDVTKPYTLPACVAYFVLNTALTYWVWAVEAGTVFAGAREGGQKLTLKSVVKKHDPTYRLHVRYEAPSGKNWEDKQVTGKFTEWFNTYGYIDKKAFRAWLAKSVDVVGQAEADSAKDANKKLDPNMDAQDTITVASGVDSSSTAGQATPAKRGRPKKKP